MRGRPADANVARPTGVIKALHERILEALLRLVYQPSVAHGCQPAMTGEGTHTDILG